MPHLHAAHKFKFSVLKEFEFLLNRTKKALTWVALWKDGTCAQFWRSHFIYRLPRGTFLAFSYSLPKKGFFCFRAQAIAWIFPSVPRTPNPPGTSTPLYKRAHDKGIPLSTRPARNNHPRSHFQATEAMKLLRILCSWATADRRAAKELYANTKN